MKEIEGLLNGNIISGHEAVTGCLDGLDEEGQVFFLPDGQTESVPVIIASTDTDEALIEGCLAGRRALALRLAGGAERLALVGFIRERVVDRPAERILENLSVSPAATPSEAVVDGQVVSFEASEQIVLKCGKGSITLRKDGKIVIKGTNLLSRSTGINRIKGGQVNIN